MLTTLLSQFMALVTVLRLSKMLQTANNVKYFPLLICSVFLIFIYPNGAQAATVNAPSIEEKLSVIVSSSKSAERKVTRLMEVSQGNDLVLVKLKLINIFRQSSQHTKAKLLLDELLNTIDQLDQELKIRILVSHAQLQRSNNNYAKAVDIMLKQVLPLALPNSPQLAKIYQLTGVFFRLQMKLEQAKKYYNLALKSFRDANDREGEAKIYSNLGVLYESYGDLVLAAEYQKRAMRYFEKVNDVAELATNYFNLGELYFRSQDYPNSLAFYVKALALDSQLNNMQDVGYDHHRIGTIYLRQNNYVEALASTQKAIEIFINLSAQQVLSRSYVQQAKIFADMNNSSARLKSLNLARIAAQRAASDHQLRVVWHSFGQYFLEKGESQKAKSYAEKALFLSDKLGLSIYQLDDYELLSQIYKNLENYKLSQQYLQLAFDLQLQLNSEQQIKEMERHKRDINLLQEQVKVTKLEEEQLRIEEEVIAHKAINQRNISIFIIIIVLLVVIVFMLYQRRRIAVLKAQLYQDALTQKNQLLADVSHELRTPLTALKLQIDALQYKLVENVDLSYQKLSSKVMDINRLISDIYELAMSDVNGLSFTTEQCDIIPMLREWSHEFSQYVEQQGFSWHLCAHVESAQVNVDIDRIKQVLSNLISNSVKYTDNPGDIQLSATIKQDALVLIVKDSAPTVNDDELERIFERLYRVEKSRNRQTGGSGLGLAISQSIILAHHGEIFAKKSNIGGLAIIIKLPLAENI